jgi:formylglycine-generating enzyme required for sulfatase activity
VDAEDDAGTLTAWWEDDGARLDAVESTVNSDGEVLGYGTLSEGEHSLELHVQDPAGNEGIALVRITVGPANTGPECAITAPASGGVSVGGERVEFTATVADAESAPNLLQIVWASDKDGDLGSSTADSAGTVSFPISSLSAADHRITMIATDDLGASCTAAVDWTVGTPPTIALETPLADELVNDGEALTFSAVVADTDDVARDLSVAWSSSIDGVFYEGPPDSTGVAQFLDAGLSVGDHLLTVTVTDSDGLYATALGTFTVNGVPSAPVVSISPASPETADDLRVRIDTASVDADGDALSYTYAWFLDGAASSASTSATLPASVTTRRDRWRVDVGSSDGYATSPVGSSSVTIGNTAPQMVTVAVSPSTGKVNDTLTCVGTASDADGDTPTMSYAWSTGSAGATLTLTEANNPGDTLTCAATATDDEGATATGSASATVSNTPPSLGIVTVRPATAYNDDVLTCSSTATDADGGAPSLGYVWTNTSTGVSLGSGDTITLSSTIAGSGESIACVITATDADGGADTQTGSLTLGNRAPVALAALSPASPTRASTLTCSGSATDADADSAVLSFRWTVDGSAVAETSATDSQSTLSGAFSAGQTVECTVTAYDGSTGSDTASVTIGNTAPVVSSVVLSPSTVYTNDMVSANVVSSDVDGDALSLGYAWYVDGVKVPTATSSALSGATAFDKGQTVYVTVTVSDGSGSTSMTSSGVTVSNTAPIAPVVTITPADAVTGDDLTCTVALPASDADGDADGDALTYRFAWDVDGVAYTSATDGTSSSVVDGADVGEDETWTCDATANDGTTEGSIGTDSVVPTSDFSDYATVHGATMVAIAAGTFEMGCADFGPIHTVTLTHDFWIGATEVTQAQYQAGMGSNPSAYSVCGGTCPVEQLSWALAARYANALSTAEGYSMCYTASGDDLVPSLAGDPYACEGYRLPTEAEWEYAARAGESYTYSGSETVGDVAWYYSNSGFKTNPVATRAPNAWGLYDMSGNVWEWINDFWGTYATGPVTDPIGAVSSSARDQRGGSWKEAATEARVGRRFNNDPVNDSSAVGFRLVRSIP